jgi:hypothetical protein
VGFHLVDYNKLVQSGAILFIKECQLGQVSQASSVCPELAITSLVHHHEAKGPEQSTTVDSGHHNNTTHLSFLSCASRARPFRWSLLLLPGAPAGSLCPLPPRLTARHLPRTSALVLRCCACPRLLVLTTDDQACELLAGHGLG